MSTCRHVGLQVSCHSAKSWRPVACRFLDSLPGLTVMFLHTWRSGGTSICRLVVLLDLTRRPHAWWIDQIQRDLSTSPVELWRHAVRRGSAVGVLQQPSPAAQHWGRRWWLQLLHVVSGLTVGVRWWQVGKLKFEYSTQLSEVHLTVSLRPIVFLFISNFRQYFRLKLNIPDGPRFTWN